MRFFETLFLPLREIQLYLIRFWQHFIVGFQELLAIHFDDVAVWKGAIVVLSAHPAVHCVLKPGHDSRASLLHVHILRDWHAPELLCVSDYPADPRLVGDISQTEHLFCPRGQFALRSG